MAKQNKVVAGCVVVDVAGQERYLYRGAVLPAGVDRKDVTRLKSNGLVAEVEVPEGEVSPETAAEPKVETADDKSAPEKPAAKQAARGSAEK